MSDWDVYWVGVALLGLGLVALGTLFRRDRDRQ